MIVPPPPSVEHFLFWVLNQWQLSPREVEKRWARVNLMGSIVIFNLNTAYCISRQWQAHFYGTIQTWPSSPFSCFYLQLSRKVTQKWTFHCLRLKSYSSWSQLRNISTRSSSHRHLDQVLISGTEMTNPLMYSILSPSSGSTSWACLWPWTSARFLVHSHGFFLSVPILP